MTTSVHLLFLLSLGVFSWAILCYFKEIEKRLMCSPINNSQEQQPSDSNEVSAHELIRDYRSSRCRDTSNYELYVNFLCVFACIYALAKVAHIAERYLARQMYSYAYNQYAFDTQTRRSPIKEDVQNLEDMLRLKIDKLTKQNLELKFELSRSANDTADQIAKMPLPPGDGLMQNIYINNRHVSLNHKVYVNSDAVMGKFHNFPEKFNKINDVWQNYLEMQKESHSRTPSMWTSIRRDSYVPVVLSTEDLQKFHGLI